MTDELKISDNKIRVNQAQYDSDREAPKISVSFGEIEKHEYLTGEDLGYKPGAAKQAKLNIFHQVRFLIKDQMKKIKKMTFEKIKRD